VGSLGDLQHLVLLAILRLGDGAYGVSIRDEIEGTAGRELSLGAIYSALRRLETQGLIRSRKGDPSPVTGGRAKTFFDVAPDGDRALREAQEELGRMVEGLAGLPLSAPPARREGEG
jgi:DNA-binding PadR family transcriptional regulator